MLNVQQLTLIFRSGFVSNGKEKVWINISSLKNKHAHLHFPTCQTTVGRAAKCFCPTAETWCLADCKGCRSKYFINRKKYPLVLFKKALVNDLIHLWQKYSRYVQLDLMTLSCNKQTDLWQANIYVITRDTAFFSFSWLESQLSLSKQLNFTVSEERSKVNDMMEILLHSNNHITTACTFCVSWN